MWGRNKQKKILCVEDDPNNHPLFREVFEAEGFMVSIIGTADDNFIDEVVGFKPDIISMDLVIGGDGAAVERDGFQAIEMLKSDTRTKDIPIMVLTNFSEESRVAKAKAMGVVDFISLQGQSIKEIPEIFMRYLKKPKKFFPSHPEFRVGNRGIE
jgi:CheY-like chemotaxis protein